MMRAASPRPARVFHSLAGLAVALALCAAWSCATAAAPDSAAGGGTARIVSFEIVEAENDFAAVPPIRCEVAEGKDSGVIRARLPGGTSPLVWGEWQVSGGTLMGGGQKLSWQKPLDLGSLRSLELVDRAGRARVYALDIAEPPIPTVYLWTEKEAPILTKTDWVKGRVAVTRGSARGSEPLAPSPMKIRGRGNSTWDMPKKPYRFTLDEAAPLLGLPKAKKWVLLANYADKSLMRNSVAFAAASSLQGLKFTPAQYPVVLVLNGRYEGIYGLGEQVETGAGRVAIEKPDESPGTSFFLEVNMRIDLPAQGGVLGKDYFVSPSGLKFEFKTPDAGEASPAQREHIAAFVAEAERAILAGEGYDRYIDVDSFIDWLILEELFKNQDSMFLSSVFFSRARGGKLTMGPVWDFDLSAGNSDYGAIGGRDVRDPEGWFALYADWFGGLLRDP
ncbi:CotH kinase family protein, partial [bacterium]|nr:CotH kinase family protein [bacterium]